MNAEEAVKPKKDQTQNNVSVMMLENKLPRSPPVRTSVENLSGVSSKDSSSDDVVIINPYAGTVVTNIPNTTTSVDYPNLFNEGVEMAKALKKSKAYGGILSSVPTAPTESVISSLDRGLDELDDYETGETTLEACTFCLRNIYPAEEAVTRLACCGFVLHEPCFRRRGWHHMPAELKCPDCSRPPQLTIDYDKEPEPPDIEDTQTFVSKFRLLIRKKGVTAGLKAIHRAYKSGEGIKKGFPEVTKTEVIRSKLRLDDLLTAGFSLDTIHTTMGVKSWEDLLAIGFNEDKLPKLEDHVGTLIRLYGIDSVCLRRDLHLSLKKLASLNLRSTTLRDLGFDTHELCFMGLQKNGIKWFQNLTMANWVEHLNFNKIHLGILKMNRRDFDNPECLAPVFWNAEGLREKLGITLDNAIRIRLIDPRDLEQREWRRGYTIATASSSSSPHKSHSNNSTRGHPHSRSNRQHQHQHHQYQHQPSGYDGFRTQQTPGLLPAPQQQQQQQPVMYQLPPELFQPDRINVAVRIPQARPGILPVPRQQLYYHPPPPQHLNYNHHVMRRPVAPVAKPREARMRGTRVNKNRGSPILKNRTGKFS